MRAGVGGVMEGLRSGAEWPGLSSGVAGVRPAGVIRGQPTKTQKGWPARSA